VSKRYTIAEISAGNCLLLPKPRDTTKHLWIILTDPDDNIKRNVVMVNLTTLKKGADKTIVLKVGDHPFIRHDSSVYYADARIVSSLQIIELLNNFYPDYDLHDDCSDVILKKIQQGVLVSDFVSEEIEDYCRARLGL